VTGGVSPAAGMDVDGPDPCWDMDDGDDDFLCGGLGPGLDEFTNYELTMGYRPCYTIEALDQLKEEWCRGVTPRSVPQRGASVPGASGPAASRTQSPESDAPGVSQELVVSLGGSLQGIVTGGVPPAILNGWSGAAAFLLCVFLLVGYVRNGYA
jgi:hypothetical protein